MEKSSLKINFFRKLLSGRKGRSYKIPRDDEVKFPNGNIINAPTNCNVDDIYAMRGRERQCRKPKANNDCDQKRIRGLICENIAKFLNHYNSTFFLPIFTPVSCSICMIIVIAALFGTSWISTEEKVPWLQQVNSSYYYYHYRHHHNHQNVSVSYITKSSNASLWIICTRQAVDESYIKFEYGSKNCTRIDYFDLEKYQPDPLTNEATNVIPYTIILSLPVLIISFVILLISYVLFLLAICASKKYKIFYFIAGIGFIISGLVMLIALIMFISIFKSEIYHKIRATSSSLEPLFTFHYGHSFILYVIGFVFVELAGILNVCLFNKLQKEVLNFNQNRLLNNTMIKHGQVDVSFNHPQPRYAFSSNGYVPYGRGGTTCSSTAANVNVNGCYNYLPSNVHSHHLMLPPSNHFNAFHHATFTRNASTSTLDFDNELDCSGDFLSRKSKEHTAKGYNICGINVQTNKSKACNSNSNTQRSKPSRNIYYIRDYNDLNEPNVLIVDPRFHKNRKSALQKSLEDIRLHNSHVRQQHYRHNTCMGSAMINRSVKTLPRDFSRPKCHSSRPSLQNFLNGFHHETESGEKRFNSLNRHHHQSQSNLCAHNYPHRANAYHHNSFDELSWQRMNRNSYHSKNCMEAAAYQWPKVIPKSPSSHSMNSNRFNRHPMMYDKSPKRHRKIEEFDLEKIERERRKSHTNLFEDCHQKDSTMSYGTAV